MKKGGDAGAAAQWFKPCRIRRVADAEMPLCGAESTGCRNMRPAPAFIGIYQHAERS
jgi:hypothetical protein